MTLIDHILITFLTLICTSNCGKFSQKEISHFKNNIYHIDMNSKISLFFYFFPQQVQPQEKYTKNSTNFLKSFKNYHFQGSTSKNHSLITS